MYLVATLYTHSLARQYLPSRLIDRWYPYRCYTLVCELLYGLVPCYALYTRDVIDHVSGTRNDKDFIVSKVSYIYWCNSAVMKEYYMMMMVGGVAVIRSPLTAVVSMGREFDPWLGYHT